ncbi:MAG: viscotoxin-A3 [Eggerthellaceae bacterium]|nr:viscotoxin-A3 [Eggerthellaceae bacterium]
MEQEQAQETISQEEYEAEDEFLSKIPRLNLGALFAAPVWGPVHGFWATILFYPAWVFADNILYNMVSTGFSVLNLILVILVFGSLIAITVGFALTSGPVSAHRAIKKGKTFARYRKEQRIWAVVGIVLFIAALVLATVFNLYIRPTL